MPNPDPKPAQPDPHAIALRCAALVKRHEDVASDIRSLMVASGMAQEDAERVNPIDYCRNVLAAWAFEKLKP